MMTQPNSDIADIFKVIGIPVPYTITSGGNERVEINILAANKAPDGYTAIGVVGVETNHGNVLLSALHRKAIALKNTHNSSVNATAYVDVLYIKTEFLN